MRTLLVLILQCFNIVSSKSSYNNEIDLIVDVVSCFERPTAVIGKLCWKPALKVELMDRLINVSNPITIAFVHEETKSLDFMSKDVILVADRNCPDIRDFFRQANDSKKFMNPHRWLIVGQADSERNVVPSQLEEVDVLVDSEVIVAHNHGDVSTTIHLYMIYKINSASEWIIEYFGTWSKSGLYKSKHMVPSVGMRRKNVAGEPIASSFVISDECTKTNLNDLSVMVDNISKFGYRLTTPLYEFLNASRVVVFTDNWGYFVNGSWNGVVGNMARGEAELGGTVMFMTSQRLDTVAYLTDPAKTVVRFVFRPPPLSYQNNLFLLPFKAAVWGCLAGFVLILLGILYINAQLEPDNMEISDWMEMTSSEQQPTKPNLSDIAMMLVSAISQQGSSIELKGPVGRLVTFLLFLAFLFLFTAYSASIVALLQSSSNQIHTLSDLLHSKLELGVEDVPYNRHYFSTATEPVRKAIYETKIAPRGSKPKYISVEEGVKKMQKYPFAFNMQTGEGYKVVEKYFHEHEKCNLQEIAFTPPYLPWLTCKKNSPFQEIFKLGLYRIREHGIGDRENRLSFVRKPTCLARGGSFDSVSIIDVYPALLMLLYGVMLAFGLLLVEIFVHHRMTMAT